MRHRLIPAEERRAMHKEYYVRVAIVSVWALAVAVVAGAAALFPADIRARAVDRAALNAVTLAKSNNKDAASLDAAEKDLSNAALLMKALGTTPTSPLSDVIRSVSAIHSPIAISLIELNRAATSSASVSIQGIAPTRSDLLAFKSRLEALAPGSTVDLPISILAKNTNVAFTLQFTTALK